MWVHFDRSTICYTINNYDKREGQSFVLAGVFHNGEDCLNRPAYRHSHNQTE